MSLLLLLILAALLYGSYRWSQLPSVQPMLQRPLVPALAMMAGFGGLVYFGQVELGARFGLSATLGFIAFSLSYLLSPLVMKPQQWAHRQLKLSTLVDLFSYRYRGTEIGPLVFTVLLLSGLPFIAIQIKIAAQTLHYLNPDLISVGWLELFIAGILVLFCAGLTLHKHHAPKLTGVLALCALLPLILLVGSAVLAVWGGFGGLAAMDQWSVTSGQASIVQRYDNNYLLVSLFLLASLTLPHLYHLKSETDPKYRRGWLLPLLLLIASLTMLPLLWTGLVKQLEVPLQQYILALPGALGQSWLAWPIALAGVLACCGGAIITLSYLARAGHHSGNQILLMPGDTLTRRARRQQRGWMIAMVALALILSAMLVTDSLTSVTLTCFIGIVQLAPGLLAALYVPILNRQGIIAGLVVGTLVWSVGLLIPLFTGAPYLSLGTEMEIGLGWALHVPVGQPVWGAWLLAALAANFITSLMISRLNRTGPEEAFYARACLVDQVSLPQRIVPKHCRWQAVMYGLTAELDERSAKRALDNVWPGDEPRQLSPLEWRQLREDLAGYLYPLLGVATTERILTRVLPLAVTPSSRQEDLRALEALLAGRQEELSGLAAELNRIRIHHRQTLQAMPLGTCSLNAEGEISLWNNALEKMTGISASEAVGHQVQQLPALWADTLSTALSADADRQFALELKRGDRRLWVNLHKSRIGPGTGDSEEMIILLEDVTDATRMTRELAHTERLASIGRLAAGVAHEIGNPVTGIACLAQDIQLDHDNPDLMESTRLILAQTERITTIVRGLIDFSRSGDNDSLQLRNVNIRESLEQAWQLLELQKEPPQVTLDLTGDDHLSVRADPHQMVQIFLNLLANARAASSDGDAIAIQWQADHGQVEITITDQGSGIPADQLEQVMEPFFTTKEAGEGTGLGLALVYSMLQSYGGDMQLISPVTDGRGTQVALQLPQASGSTVAASL